MRGNTQPAPPFLGPCGHRSELLGNSSAFFCPPPYDWSVNGCCDGGRWSVFAFLLLPRTRLGSAQSGLRSDPLLRSSMRHDPLSLCAPLARADLSNHCCMDSTRMCKFWGGGQCALWQVPAALRRALPDRRSRSIAVLGRIVQSSASPLPGQRPQEGHRRVFFGHPCFQKAGVWHVPRAVAAMPRNTLTIIYGCLPGRCLWH